MFGGLGLEGQPYGSSVRNISEGSFTEEGTVLVNYIFEGGFKLTASEERKKFDSIASEFWGVIGEKSGSNREMIGE